MMVTKRSSRGESKNYFRVMLDGVEISGFERVSHLQSGIEVGFSDDDSDKIPGKSFCQNVILHKKRTREQPFWNWLKDVQSGNLVKKNIQIELIYRNKSLRGWNLVNCWPCRWSISDITDDVMNTLEEIELVVEKIELI
jgi:phage tail-like protein